MPFCCNSVSVCFFVSLCAIDVNNDNRCVSESSSDPYQVDQISPFPVASQTLIPNPKEKNKPAAIVIAKPQQQQQPDLDINNKGDHDSTDLTAKQEQSLVGPSKTGNLFLDFTSPPTSCRIPKLKTAAERLALAAVTSDGVDISSQSAPNSPMVGRRHSLPKRSATPSNQVPQTPSTPVPATVPSTPTTPRPVRRILTSSSTDTDDYSKRNVAFSLPEHAFVLPDQEDQDVFTSDELDDLPEAANGAGRGSNTPRLQRKPGEGKADPSSSRPSSPRKGRSLSFGASAGRPTLSSANKTTRRPITPEPTSSAASARKGNGASTPTAQKNLVPPGSPGPRKLTSGASTLPRRTSKLATAPSTPTTPTTPTATRRAFGLAAKQKAMKDDDSRSKTLLPLTGTLNQLSFLLHLSMAESFSCTF